MSLGCCRAVPGLTVVRALGDDWAMSLILIGTVARLLAARSFTEAPSCPQANRLSRRAEQALWR